MKKDNYRDYVVDAMRFYAACNCPNEIELSRIKNALPRHDARYLDLQAVYNMLKRLSKEEYGATGVRAVEIVYFQRPERPAARNEITNRVTNAATELNVCDSTIYKSLRRARYLIAEELGLRIDDDPVSIRHIIGKY